MKKALKPIVLEINCMCTRLVAPHLIMTVFYIVF